MAHDYRGFQDKIGADMASASAAAAGFEKGKKGTRVRIRKSDLEPLIPSGATIEFTTVAAHKITFGDIILIRTEKEMVLRRFMSLNFDRGTTILSVARMNPAQEESYVDTALVGKITTVESKGVTFDPLKKESQLERWKNEWTFFGTSSMFSRFSKRLKLFRKMMKKN